MQPVFGVTGYEAEKEYITVRNMLSWSPAGLIVTGLDQRGETLRRLENAGVLVVQIMDVDGAPVDACIGVSHHAAGEAIGEALIGMGRKRFAFIGSDFNKDLRAQKRLEGFKKTLSKHGLDLVDIRISGGASTTTIGRDQTAQALTDNRDLDCLYYANDDLAAGGAFH